MMKDKPIEKVILVCDVDGVIRHSTEEHADTRIVSTLKDYLQRGLIANAAFISGTPIKQDSSLEVWRKGNSTLDMAIGHYFATEIANNQVTLFGAFGGQRMLQNHTVAMLHEYPINLIFLIGKLLLKAFLQEVRVDGDDQQKKSAERLQYLVDNLQLKDEGQTPLITPKEFTEIILAIRAEIDPDFRLISYGSFMESQTTYPHWGGRTPFKWLQRQVEINEDFQKIPKSQKCVASGVAYRNHNGFNFLTVSKSNKREAIKAYMHEQASLNPEALIITVGDTQVDFLMHEEAHLAFHVGKRHVWHEYPLSHCHLVLHQDGTDSQHVEGTLRVLDLIKQNFGKPLNAWDLSIQ